MYADASLDVVKQRDPKGLYKKALAGEIKDFTGVSSPYEAPEHPEIHLQTGSAPVAACVEVAAPFPPPFLAGSFAQTDLLGLLPACSQVLAREKLDQAPLVFLVVLSRSSSSRHPTAPSMVQT